MSNYRCVVIHSGGMDSSICLAQAIRHYGKESVVSLGFDYQQRHAQELEAARTIAHDWGVRREEIKAPLIAELTSNALVNREIAISGPQEPINTLVAGRNGLMCWLAALWAFQRSSYQLSIGVIEVEGSNSGYRDCSRSYIDRVEALLRIDLGLEEFKILTPVVAMSKCQTLELAHQYGVLNYLLERAVSCYEGIALKGCRRCPACLLRNEGLAEFARLHPEHLLPKPLRAS